MANTVDHTILDKILDEVGFYGEYPDMREEEYLVLVTLYDYTARNFQRRTSTNEDADVPPRDERDAKSPKFLGRTFIYPPTSETFQVWHLWLVPFKVQSCDLSVIALTSFGTVGSY